MNTVTCPTCRGSGTVYANDDFSYRKIPATCRDCGLTFKVVRLQELSDPVLWNSSGTIVTCMDHVGIKSEDMTMYIGNRYARITL